MNLGTGKGQELCSKAGVPSRAQGPKAVEKAPDSSPCRGKPPRKPPLQQMLQVSLTLTVCTWTSRPSSPSYTVTAEPGPHHPRRPTRTLRPRLSLSLKTRTPPLMSPS